MNRRDNIFSAKLSFIRPLALCLLPSFAFAGSAITGSVRNQSTGAAAAGDEVILLRLLNGMQEEARTRIDSQGSFTFNAQLPESRYLVRVMHQAVNYDREAPLGGGAVTINVFDAAPAVKGVSGKIEIMRIGSERNSLHVSDLYDIKNDSSPPLTQASEHNFEFYLPPKAVISSVMAAGPNSGGVKISAAAVAAEPGHYTLNFPLRPGETKFAINYDLPYSGHAVLRPRLFYPVEQLAVMFPPSMSFKSDSPGFHPLMNEKDVDVEALNQVAAGPAPAFEISGNGAPPPLSSAHPKPETRPQAPFDVQARPAAPSKAPASASNSQHPTLDAASASAQANSLLIPVAIGAVLVVGLGLVIWSRRARKPVSQTVPTRTPATQSARLVEAVKEELFQLEQEKLRGTISREEYATAKQALDQAVERAVTKAAAQKQV
jgi:hypothetical protein